MLTQQLRELESDIDRLTVLRIESGDRLVADYEVKALAEGLGVGIWELFARDGG